MYDFQDFIMRTRLLDAGFLGDPFTWCNNRNGRLCIWERLDRALYNTEFHSLFPTVTVTHLPWVSSDHSPLLIKLQRENAKPGSGFVFQRIWTDHPDFLSTIRESWRHPAAGPPGLILQHKL